MSSKRPTTVKPPPLKFCKKDEQTAYDVKHSAGDKKTSKKVKSNDRKETSSEIVVDIQTEGEYYTEVFSGGNDSDGQLGIGENRNQSEGQLIGASNSHSVPRFCSYNITIR